MFEVPFKRFSLAEVTELYSERVDKIILKNEEDCRKFGAGRFYINVIKNTAFKTFIEIYFIDLDKSYSAAKEGNILMTMSELTFGAIRACW